MKNVIFHPLTEQELLDAVFYYKKQETGLGLEYLGEVEHGVIFSCATLSSLKLEVTSLG
jgi:toxin ParE1/3/4